MLADDLLYHFSDEGDDEDALLDSDVGDEALVNKMHYSLAEM